MMVDLILEIPLHCKYTWQTWRWSIKCDGRVWRGAGCWLWEETEYSNWWQRQTVLLSLQTENMKHFKYGVVRERTARVLSGWVAATGY